jgi:hypothetical protein
MSFSVSFTATSKNEALQKLENAVLPKSVAEFIAIAIDGFKEEGGNKKIVTTDVATRAIEGGEAENPVAITVSASGHLDLAGNGSNLTVNVAKA